MLIVAAPLRHPEAPTVEATQTPGGCPGDADLDSVVSAAEALGARVAAILTHAWTGARPALEALAEATGATHDLDGDGVAEPLIFELNEGSSSFEDDFQSALVEVATRIAAAEPVDEVRAVLIEDPGELVVSVTPDAYATPDPLDREGRYPFEIRLRAPADPSPEWRGFDVVIEARSDRGVTVARWRRRVMVPPS